MSTAIQAFRTDLATPDIQKKITNYFGGDEARARKFMSAAVHSVEKTPQLLNCDKGSLMNAFITCAELELYPSAFSGEAYVLPYKKGGGMQAQFQIGYQGLVTLFYRAGVRSIVAEIVYEKDKFTYISGVVHHEPDFFADDRGAAKGAYVIIELQDGGKVAKVMSKKEILAIAEKFSKSYKSDFTPWKESNDPQLWMWKKTVLKQCSKIVPKNETIYRAVELDNRDSIVSDRENARRIDPQALREGAPTTAKLTAKKGKKDHDKNTQTEEEEKSSDLFEGIADNHPGDEADDS